MIFDLGLNVNSTHISINKKYFKLENALIGWSNPFSSALQVKKISVCVFFEKEVLKFFKRKSLRI
jgi:hypothetical protein